MEALYLKSQRYPHWEIAQLIRVTEPTLLSYFRDYQTGGIAQLKELTFYRPQSELKQHQQSLEAYFRAHPPKTLAQAAAKIEELSGIVRSREQVRQFLKSIGMSCRRVGVLPAKADPEAQEEFVKKTRPSLRGGENRSASRFLCRCRPFCSGCLLRIFVVL
jgi:transposase